MKRISTCFVSDGNFAPWLTVAALSGLENLRSGWCMEINVICDSSFSLSQRKKVEHSLSQKLNWLEVNRELFVGLPEKQSGSLVPYYKFLLPQLLPADQDKAILLDCDLLVKMDLSRLWEQRLGQNWLLAAQDAAIPTVGSLGGLVRYRSLGLKASLPYFNSGVMLINLSKWRENRVTETLLDFSKLNLVYLRHFDQDSMNYVCRNHWDRLPNDWNRIYSINETFPQKSRNGKHGTIIHFAGYFKPWKVELSGDCCEEFFEFLDRTAWRGLRAPKKLRVALATFYFKYLRRYFYLTERFLFHYLRDLKRVMTFYRKREFLSRVNH